MTAFENVTLPGGFYLGADPARQLFNRYIEEQRPILDLYDATNPGPHDEILPVDILALNALNAFARTSPATPMAAIWVRRASVAEQARKITRERIEDLEDDALETAISATVTALTEIECTVGFRTGGTRAAKLLHRLRPNVVPIWDRLVGEWYGGSAQSWPDFLHAAARDVRIPENSAFLKSLVVPDGLSLSIYRRWDILLWRARYELGQSARGGLHPKSASHLTWDSLKRTPHR